MRVETHKFIGGPKDGERIVVQRDRHYVDVAVLDPLPAGWWNDPKHDVTAGYHKVSYQRAMIVGSLQTFVVWTPCDWDGDRLIQELIDRA